MSTHTPEPWYTGSGACHEVFAKQGRWQNHLATVYNTENSRSDFQNTEHLIDSVGAFANASRIVACVNACAGIANPEAVPDMLEALRGVAYMSQSGTGWSREEIEKVARNAIAKATGGKS